MLIKRANDTEDSMKKSFYFMSWASKYSFVAIFLILVALSTILSPVFLTSGNIFNIFLETSILGVVSIGATCVILIAGIDLSVGGVIALSGMVAAVISSSNHGGPILGILAAVATGLIVGIVNGVATVYGKVPSFIVTLATGTVAGGLALLVTNGQPVYNLPSSFLALGGGNIGPISVLTIIWLTISVITIIVLRWTPVGRHIYALGDNSYAAFLSGIRVDLYTISTFAFCGLLSGLAGVLYASWVNVGYPNAGSSYTLQSIAAVVIGGTSLFGGRGGVGGTILGALMLTVFTNIFNLVGLPAVWQMVGYGSLILIAALLNHWLQQYRR